MEMARLGDGSVNLTEHGRALLEQVVNEAMGAMAEAAAGDAGTSTSRNGYRDRRLNAVLGTLDLRIPKPSSGPARSSPRT